MRLKNKEVVEKIVAEVFNKKQYDLIDDLYSDELTCEDRSLDTPVSGKKELVASLKKQHEIFPDIQYTLEHAIYEDDKAAICWIASGSLKANLAEEAPATENSFSIQGMSFLQFSEGKICRIWQQVDTESTRSQLDLNPKELYVHGG